jgi:hypothetical protein
MELLTIATQTNNKDGEISQTGKVLEDEEPIDIDVSIPFDAAA